MSVEKKLFEMDMTFWNNPRTNTGNRWEKITISNDEDSNIVDHFEPGHAYYLKDTIDEEIINKLWEKTNTVTQQNVKKGIASAFKNYYSMAADGWATHHYGRTGIYITKKDGTLGIEIDTQNEETYYIVYSTEVPEELWGKWNKNNDNQIHNVFYLDEHSVEDEWDEEILALIEELLEKREYKTNLGRLELGKTYHFINNIEEYNTDTCVEFSDLQNDMYYCFGGGQTPSIYDLSEDEDKDLSEGITITQDLVNAATAYGVDLSLLEEFLILD